MLSLVLSAIAFFVASFYIKRWLDGMDIPKGMTRTIMIFVAAAAVSYGVAFVVEAMQRWIR
jgi:VIT1/CCC1 family predicted Fe2+/Mn2+ transporter